MKNNFSIFHSAMFDKFCYYYYLIHIPITLIIDSSVVIPPIFSFQKAIVDFHITTNNDILLTAKPLWFKGFVWIEVLFQLPFFIYSVTKGILHVYNVIYGTNAAITTFASILFVIGEGPGMGLSQAQIVKLVGVYVPYVIIPMVIIKGSIGALESRKERLERETRA